MNASASIVVKGNVSDEKFAAAEPTSAFRSKSAHANVLDLPSAPLKQTGPSGSQQERQQHRSVERTEASRI